MAPNSRIYITRHGQAAHNVDADCPTLDAPLTDLGVKQVSTLVPQLSGIHDTIDLIVTSPLHRAIQTTLLGWAPAVERLGFPSIICLPQAQKCKADPCDTGSPREVLENLPEFKGLNFQRLTSDWTSKQGFYSPDPESIAKRAAWVRRFLRERPEKNIVLTAHSDVLQQFVASKEGPSKYVWKNAEVRVYEFDPETLWNEECYFKEIQESPAAVGYEKGSTEKDLLDV